MTDEPLIPTFVPPLVTLLVNAERTKGSSLTRDEVESIRDRGVCIMLPQSEAESVHAASGLDVIDPDNVWEDWQAIRQSLPTVPKSDLPERGRCRFLFSETSIADLPDDPIERHEAFLNMLGRQIFSIRNEVLERTRGLVEAPQSRRDEMGTIYSKEYTAAAQLDEAGQDAALNLCRKAIDSFLRDLLGLLTHNGRSIDLAFGRDHAFAFKLLMQVMRKDNLHVVEEHVVNEGGKKVFADYYGRWLNRHGDA